MKTIRRSYYALGMIGFFPFVALTGFANSIQHGPWGLFFAIALGALLLYRRDPPALISVLLGNAASFLLGIAFVTWWFGVLD